MDLHGLIGGPAPHSTGGEGKAPAPGPEGGARAFGEVVASNRRQRVTQGGAGEAGAESGDRPERKPGQLPAHMFEAADSPANGLSAGLHPGLQAAEIVAAAPDAGAHAPPGAPDKPIPDHDNAFDLPETRASAVAFAGPGTPAPPGAEPRPTSSGPPTPAAGGPPAQLAGAPARAMPGVVFTALPGAPGASVPPPLGGDADAVNPPPRAAGETAAPDPGISTARPAPANTAVPASPRAGSDPAPPQPGEPVATSPRMTGATQAQAGDRAPAPGTTSPGPLPGLGPRPANDLPGRMRADERAAQPAPATLPVRASSPPPGGPPIEPRPGPMPVLPELPSAATRGKGPAVRDAVMQALGDSDRVGLAVSSAATAQSPAGPAQAPAAAQPAHAGSAGTAHAVAAQIAAAIGPGPGSGRIELRLDPPELGTVEISLEITGQSLRATLAAERPATNELLHRHGEILLAQLRQAGFSGIDLQFTGNRAGDQGGAKPGEAPLPAPAGDRDAPPHGDDAEPGSRVARRTTTGGLDLRL